MPNGFLVLILQQKANLAYMWLLHTFTWMFIDIINDKLFVKRSNIMHTGGLFLFRGLLVALELNSYRLKRVLIHISRDYNDDCTSNTTLRQSEYPESLSKEGKLLG